MGGKEKTDLWIENGWKECDPSVPTVFFFSFFFFYPATNPSTASMVYRALLMFVVISEISRWRKSHIGKSTLISDCFPQTGLSAAVVFRWLA